MSDDTKTVAGVAWMAARIVRGLDPGALAAVRRMKVDAACPTFWRLNAQAGDVMTGNRAGWVEILRALALLTPKGRVEDRMDPRGAPVSLGCALCDGGDPAWPVAGERPRPVLSEIRLARLLSARGAARHTALTRAFRALAANWPADRQIDPVQLAWAYLNPDRSDVIASSYYLRLDQAEAIQKKAKEASQ